MNNQERMAQALADARRPYADAIMAKESELSALRLENARLRQALEAQHQILGPISLRSNLPQVVRTSLKNAAGMIRAALKGEA